MLSMAACSDDDGRTPSPAVDPNCIGASFVGDNIGYEELEDTDPKELTLTISRDKTEAAATVAIEVQANTENIFNIPQSVSFAAGQATADLVITFENAQLKEEYSFQISLEAAAVNPYKGNGHASFTVQCLKWVDVSGTFAFKDWVFDEYNAGKEYNVKVQRVDGENRYRIVDPFSQALAESGEEVGEPDEYLFFTINPKNNGVAFDSYNTGYLTEEGSDILGFSSLDYLGVDDVDSKYDPTSHKMTLNVYYYGDGLIGQKESVLTVPDDFKLILENGSETYTYQGKIAGSFVSADTYLVIPEGVYRSMNPRGTAYGYLWVDCDKKDVTSVEQSLNTLISNTLHIKMDTYHAQLQSAEYASRMMKLGCYLFMAIVGLIGFMNLANTMIINITTKKQEYGVLQAVGMTNKQLNLSLQIQGLIFTVGTICVALAAGLPLGYALFSYAKHNGIFGMNVYHVPLIPILVMILLVGILQIVLSCVLSSNLKKETLVERIRYQG